MKNSLGRSDRPSRQRIHLSGIVQGVGFRPFVYNLARSLDVKGYVQNTARGVTIEVEGPDLGAFVERVRSDAPALSRIETLTVEELAACGHGEFVIRPSLDRTEDFGLISPDGAVCPDCLREILDPSDRRYLYPFTNCTNCGPRYSIILGVPYDRAGTTMAGFVMCPDCEREYRDSSDRRFHAQPNACPVCGPDITFVEAAAPLTISPREVRAGQNTPSCRERAAVRGSEALRLTIRALKEGKIVAIKGLGGFHLACDATNEEAVGRLRERKRKSNKPFALMAPDTGTLRAWCRVSEAEAAALTGAARPIVLLRRRSGGADEEAGRRNRAASSGAPPMISEAAAPGNRDMGFMLPYTPLHYLLFHNPVDDRAPEDLHRRKPAPAPNFPALVMTSGNLSEEPIVTDNQEALEKLGGMADCFLLHDRDIYMRVDDSILRVVAGGVRMIRRSRGYAPEALRMRMGSVEQGRTPEILACGADLKNTFCLTKGGYAILSQHIGDLEGAEALEFFEETLGNLGRSFRTEPAAVAHDLHPDYLSAKLALSLAADRKVPVQHHHAHVASCMAEHGLEGQVIGVAFDGAGYGVDGAVWGGEFLVADYREFRRAAHLKYVALPGGDQAAREPWRMAVSYLATIGRAEEIDCAQADVPFALSRNPVGPEAVAAVSRALGGRIDDEAVGVVLRMVRQGINSPPTSSAGRLFDAVSSLLGIADRSTFEGEAAIALEHAADEGCEEVYEYEIAGGSVAEIGGEGAAGPGDSGPAPSVGEVGTVDFSPTIRSILSDLDKRVLSGIVSAKFHNTVAAAVAEMCGRLREATGLGRVALSGGVFQNRLLLERCFERLGRAGFEVYAHERVPSNDGGISLGQAAICAARLRVR